MISLVILIISVFIIHNYILNKTSDVNEIIFLSKPTKEILYEKLGNRLPIIINGLIVKDEILYELKPQELSDGNPDYLISYNMKILKFSEFITTGGNIINDGKIIDDFKMDFRIRRLLYGFSQGIHCNHNTLFSMYMSPMKLLPEYNKNNICIIIQLNGEQTINLFHPRYNSELKNKTTEIWDPINTEINGNLNNIQYIEINLKSGQMLYIPPLWRWCSMVNKDCIYVKYSCDSYFTTIYNRIKN
mgnify:CR=1 FL=1